MAQTEQQAKDTFRTYLKLVYSQQPAPCITEWPPNTDESFNYVDVDITVILKGHNTHIHLDKIFQSIPAPNRGRALLQGPAGSGKSTLAWKAGKKWASGESFTEFELFITLQLNEPYLHAAKTLEDILPTSLDEEDSRDIASYIKKYDGNKVAFLLDGWDQFQQNKCSYIVKLVRGEVLTLASVVVTSRNHTLPFLFHPPASMMLSGFSSDQVLGYLVSLPFASVELRIIIGLCSHPLNAAIVKYILQVGWNSESGLPSTSTGLMYYFIRHCLLRHFEREKDADILHKDLKQLLGKEEEAAFAKICGLAFCNIIEQKRLLTIGDLQACDINPENSVELLGLIRKKHQEYYEFNHETIQECLAAYCMHVEQNRHLEFSHETIQEHLTAYCMHVEQNRHLEFNQETGRECLEAYGMPMKQNRLLYQFMKSLLERNPTTMVVPFYAGFSRTAFKHVLYTVLKDFGFPDSSSANIPAVNDGSHATQCNQLLTVVKAIYEAQSPDLCNMLAARVYKFPIHLVHRSPALTFWYMREPLQYLHVAYFLANASILPMKLCVDFGANNTLNVFSAELFTHYLLRASERKQLKMLKVDLNLGKEVEEDAVAMIAQLIRKTSLVSGLRLGWTSETNAGHALRSLVKSVLVSTSLESLYFRDGILTEQHVWYLILLLSCSKHLKRLHLGRNHIGIGVSLLAIALKHNDTLTHINLSDCGIGSSQLRCLQETLKTNSTLEHLDISFNPFTIDDFFELLVAINNNANHSLRVLRHSHSFTGGYRVMIEFMAGAINYNRHNRNLPELLLPHAGEEIAITPGGNHLAEFFRQTPFAANVDMMSSTIGEVDAPGSTHGEPPQILSVLQQLGSVFSRASAAHQSTANQSTNTTPLTILIDENDTGIQINISTEEQS